MSTLLYLVAMQGEAAPFIASLGLCERTTPALRPFRHFSDEEGSIHLVTSGVDTRFRSTMGGFVDQVGLAPAAAMTFAAIAHIKPRQVINFGTAGAYECLGSKIAATYLCSEFYCHDRQIPISAEWEAYGRGSYIFPHHEKLAHIPKGIASSGNALTIEPHQDELLRALGKTKGLPVVKDMEAVAIAQVAHMLGFPFLAIKSVTDLIDGGRHTHEEFLENFHRASLALHRELHDVHKYLTGATSV